MTEKFDIKNLSGLSKEEVEQRLKEDGYNELPSQRKQTIFDIFLNVIREPMLILLLIGGGIYLILGNVKDALMLLSFVFVVIGITFYQERKSERTLEALRDLSSPRALVIRNGEQKRIAGREVVKEDILILKEGDRIPADAIILSCSNLMIDESLLTGESLPVGKSEWNGKTKIESPGGNNLPFVYSGTLVVSGRGIAKVVRTGIYTEMGKIGKALSSIQRENTLLQKETGKLIRNFAIVGIILCIIVIMIYGITRGNWLGGFLSGLTLSMALLPEEYSVILVIFFTLGAWRIAKKQVLTRRLPAIETLGATTVLSVDKTGTITQNRMLLKTLLTNSSHLDIEDSNKTKLPEKLHDLLEYAVLASQKDPFDPVEKEIKNIGEQYLQNTKHLHHNWKLVHEYPLSKTLFALSHVWESKDKRNYVIAAKGAPEAIADLCHLTKKEKDELNNKINKLACGGLRLIAVAKSSFSKTKLPSKQHDFSFEFMGLLGFTDPIRGTVPEAIKECYKAGIRVIMITGDYPGTAQYIAREVGLQNPDLFITGSELAQMSPEKLQEKIKTVNIFARIVPEQKLAIVNALKKDGEIVAMTGDGVNDAPALKSAHIGIAMGERGTDVAREASGIVLLNDDFSSIVAAVRLGRRIFDNLKKAVVYIFAVHVPIAGMSLFPILFQLPVVLLPAHIAFLELIIDPACSIVFESQPEDKDIMNRPPRNLKEPMFDRKTLFVSLMQGLIVLSIVLIVYLITISLGKGEIEARSLTFGTLVVANLMLIITNLSWSKSFLQILKTPNYALWWVLIGASTFLMLVIYIPFLRSLFHFSVLHLEDIFVIFIAGIVSIAWFEGFKIINKRINLS